jgi:hypothetical protein
MMKETVISRAVRVMCAGGLAVGMQAAFAQTAPEAPIQRVEITGSSLKRVDSETALPVQTISKADIAKIGATSTQELLGTISARPPPALPTTPLAQAPRPMACPPSRCAAWAANAPWCW